MAERRGVSYTLFQLACRLVPAALFLWAGFAKAFDRQGSILAVSAYDVLPESLVKPVAMLLPWVEIAVGVLLVLGLFTRFAGLATAGLMSAFIVGLAQAKARGLKINCGCFGTGGPGSGVTWWELIRDTGLLAAGTFLVWRPRGALQLDDYFLRKDGDVEANEA